MGNNENKLEELIDKKYNEKMKPVLISLDTLHIEKNYTSKLFDWFVEVCYKNLSIYRSKISDTQQDQETYNKAKQNVYLIDFGKTIGTEIHDEHFAVVIKELDCIAIIVPLTSKKDFIPQWMDNNDLIIDIGEVHGFPNEAKECYANVSAIQSVSKKRLSKYGDKQNGLYYDLYLDDCQMLKIQELIFRKFCDKLIDNGE